MMVVAPLVSVRKCWGNAQGGCTASSALPDIAASTLGSMINEAVAARNEAPVEMNVLLSIVFSAVMISPFLPYLSQGKLHSSRLLGVGGP
jgi:uncharacterized membrane protein